MKILFALLLLLLFVPTSADELYVRNRPFEGVVEGYGDDVQVELEVLAEALDVPVYKTVNGGLYISREEPTQEDLKAVPRAQVWVEGQAVDTMLGLTGKRLVNLQIFCDLVGVRVKRNSALGTIDVSVPVAKGDIQENVAKNRPKVRMGGTHEELSALSPRWRPRQDEKTSLHGYWNDEAETWAIKPKFGDAGNFSYGLAPAQTSSKSYVVTRTEQRKDDYIWIGGKKHGESFTKTRNVRVNDRNTVQGKWGYLDASGEWVIEPQFEYPVSFKLYNDRLYASVSKKGRRFWIDAAGNEVPSPSGR